MMRHEHEPGSASAWEVNLAGAIDAAAVEALRETWLAGAWPGRDVVLDLSGLEGLHTGAVQALVALRKRTVRGGGRFQIRAISGAARSILEMLGVADELGLGGQPEVRP